MRILRKGDRGKEVLDVQSRLRRLGYDLGTDDVDGFFGEGTRQAVLRFQQECGLVADGVVAENTWCELVEAQYEPGERLLYLRIPPFRGADVLTLQRSLNQLGFNAGPEDGIFGVQTERGVLDFQKNAGLVVDGMVDDSVLRVLARVTKDGDLHSNEAKIPDRNGGLAYGNSPDQLIVAIDPGHGGEDEGACHSSGLKEKELNLAVSQSLAKALKTLGGKAILTRTGDVDVPLYDRPAVANAAGADVFISIHHNSIPSAKAQGAAGYYFCRQGYFSEAGRMMAEHIVASLSRELAIPEIPVLGRNFAILRETEMTAVLIEPSFISSGEASVTAEREYPSRAAEAIFQGLCKYFAFK